MATEKSPLLGQQGSFDSYGQPSESPSAPALPAESRSVTVPPIGPDELPPPYTSPSSQGGVLMVSCRVCGFMIDISGKRDQHVVKCGSCNEATPIKNAPPGKRYVPCPCNCLLICKSTSQKIACPRPNCKRIINLAPSTATIVPGMCQVSCAHCHNLFLFNTLNNSLARCPHCRHVSSVGHQFSRSRAIRHLACAICCLLVSLVILGALISAGKYPALFVIPAVILVMSAIFFGFSIYHCTMKISVIESAT